MKTLFKVLFLFITLTSLFTQCEKDEIDLGYEIGYPEYSGDLIYTAEESGIISSIHWISDTKLVVIEADVGSFIHWTYSIKQIDIQSNIEIVDLVKGEGEVNYSVISDNNNFVYYYVSDPTKSREGMVRLDLTTGEQLRFLENKIINPPFYVSTDDSKIAYKKASFIWVYDITTGNDVQLFEATPIMFTNDNSELLYSKSFFLSFPIYSYNLESGESKVVFSDQNINFQNSDFDPKFLISAINENGNILIVLSGSEDDFLVYNLTEAHPIFLGAMEPYGVYSGDNLICEGLGSSHYGCNFAIDTRKMELFSWDFECINKKYEGWSYSCIPYRYNLSCTDMISNEKTRTGNVLNKYVGTTKISPDGTKLGYVSGNDKLNQYHRYIHLYNVAD